MPVAEHRDDVGYTMARREGNGRLELQQQHSMVCRVIEAGLDKIFPCRWVAHRAYETVLPDWFPVVWGEEVDADKAHRSRAAAKVGKGDLPVGPARHRLFKAT
jgi:hypothetical protein